MPSVQRAHDAFQDTDAVVLTIVLGSGGMLPVDTYLTGNRYTMPTLLDTDMQVAQAFGIRGIPATIIIGRQGTIIAQGHGALDFDRPDFRQYVQALLAQPHKSRGMR